MEEVYGELHTLIGQTPVKLSKQMGVSKICFVKKYLQSILYTFLSNAIKYCSAERLLAITIETYRQGKYTLLEVTGNGLGMEESQIPKLFTMFKRFHTHVEGTGIGLYMVKKDDRKCRWQDRSRESAGRRNHRKGILTTFNG